MCGVCLYNLCIRLSGPIQKRVNQQTSPNILFFSSPVISSIVSINVVSHLGFVPVWPPLRLSHTHRNEKLIKKVFFFLSNFKHSLNWSVTGVLCVFGIHHFSILVWYSTFDIIAYIKNYCIWYKYTRYTIPGTGILDIYSYTLKFKLFSIFNA